MRWATHTERLLSVVSPGLFACLFGGGFSSTYPPFIRPRPAPRGAVVVVVSVVSVSGTSLLNGVAAFLRPFTRPPLIGWKGGGGLLEVSPRRGSPAAALAACVIEK